MEVGIAEIADAREAPRLAANLIRTAPLEIYVDGFRHDRQRRDHDRFSGSAVNFLPLAHFD
ncbi:MAG: hypothetical protein L0I29_02890 [Hyphomicrobiales bacterium]|nr:hypothetical protein [Hyphomicrobiales bacterium]